MSRKSPIKNPPSGEPERQRPLGGRGLRFIPGGFWEKSGAWRLRERVTGSDYIQFLGESPPALLFCALWILSSGFGQTFFLSIFQPYWLL